MQNNSDPSAQDSSTSPPPAHPSSSTDFQRRKFFWALAIMGVGMLIALVWNAIQGWGLGRDYPYNTFLFRPDYRFNDLTDMTLAASRANPYEDPFTAYLPFAWPFFRALGAMPYWFGLTAFLFVSVGGMFVLLFTVLDEIVPSPWPRAFWSLVCLFLSYPVLAAFDRANLDILVAPVVALALLLFSRGKYAWGALCLLPVVSFKFYPAAFLLLLLRQRRVGTIAWVIIAFLVLILLSMVALSLPLETGFELYGRNLVLINRFYIYENYELEGASSLWNACKLALVTAADLGVIRPIDFSYDGRFIGGAYSIYSACSGFMVLVLAVYVCLVEKEFLRCVIVLLLYVSTAAPLGGDYRLLYIGIALVVLILAKTRRPYDLLVVVLLALIMVPKKEILLTYAGKTETGYADVSIQSLLNPFIILAALLLMLYECRTTLDWRWTRLRVRRVLGTILPQAAVSSGAR